MRKRIVVSIVSLAAVTASMGDAQHHHGSSPTPSSSPGPRRITMEELHALGGVPRGWKFALPEGDVARGKQVFAEAGCYKCHTVEGAGFPDAGAEKKPGPDLTGMGSHHPPEYFAESIVAPNAVILDGPGYTGPDRRSIMPGYADSLSVRQLLDVVAFLKSQTASPGGHHHHGGRELTASAGDYTIRLVHQPGVRAAHLLVFVSDRITGEPVPYLPVTLTFKHKGQSPRVVRLTPMMGSQGFHYGADAVIPGQVDHVDVSVGPTTMKVLASAKGRFATPARASFEW